MSKVSMLLNQIDSGTVLLPEFQRGYVWNRDQVRGLMRSLYLGHPVGGLLMWETIAEGLSVRGGAPGIGSHLLLLDGQQRVTSLYGVIRGNPPAFFEGDSSAFTGLYFNVETETFEFYAPSKMADDIRWVNVTELFKTGPVPFLGKFADQPDKANLYLDRLNKLWQVTQKEFNQEKITGADKTVDDVVEIFNRVNSGGTKLSKGDLALARLCAQWPDARSVMRSNLAHWKESGFHFSLDWLLRNATAVATGRSLFTALEKVAPEEFQEALSKSVDYVGTFLDAVSGRLGLDHDRVLMGRYAIPVVSRLLGLNNGNFNDSAHRDKVLYWYIQSALWGRFAGSTETYLQQDYDTARREGIDGLIAALQRVRGGNLEIQAHDFEGSTRGSRFYPLLYMLTRVKGARDFGSGLELKAESLGKLSSLQVHHIFPKALLRNEYDRNQVNAIANFCFLTQLTNIAVGKRAPEDYFAEAEAKHPGVLASQWIPTDPDLWRVDRYLDFLAARRELLAQAAQSLLDELWTGTASAASADLQPLAVFDEETDDARTAQLNDLVDELLRLGCTEPVRDSEISDPSSGGVLAVAEAFWPEGLQPGQGAPVVLELDPETANMPRLEEMGYEVFTSVDALLGFVNRRNEIASGEPEKSVDSPVEETTTTPDSVLPEFAQRMHAIYDRARREAGYTASYFLSMLADLGPIETAHKLLNTRAVSDGFATLWERGRLDLTVEALALDPKFRSLFTDRELETARSRLEQFGYVPRDVVAR